MKDSRSIFFFDDLVMILGVQGVQLGPMGSLDPKPDFVQPCLVMAWSK
jgi:hypothetical protein